MKVAVIGEAMAAPVTKACVNGTVDDKYLSALAARV